MHVSHILILKQRQPNERNVKGSSLTIKFIQDDVRKCILKQKMFKMFCRCAALHDSVLKLIFHY